MTARAIGHFSDDRSSSRVAPAPPVAASRRPVNRGPVMPSARPGTLIRGCRPVAVHPLVRSCPLGSLAREVVASSLVTAWGYTRPIPSGRVLVSGPPLDRHPAPTPDAPLHSRDGRPARTVAGTRARTRAITRRTSTPGTGVGTGPGLIPASGPECLRPCPSAASGHRRASAPTRRVGESGIVTVTLPVSVSAPSLTV